MEQPLVSVILPTYNREKYILRAIESVLSQDYKNIELIVVDDGSTDHTKTLVEEYPDERVRYMRTPVNRGVAFARNAGIRRARGEFIAFQDSDDVWLPGKLTKQIEQLLTADEETAVSYHIMARISPTGERRWIPSEQTPMDSRSGKIYERLLRINHIGAPALCVRRDALTGPDGVGVFDTELPNLEDYDLVLRLARKYRIAYVDETLIETYQLSDGTNNDLMKGIVSKCMIIGRYQEDLVRLGLYDTFLKSLRQFGDMAGTREFVDQAIRVYCSEK